MSGDSIRTLLVEDHEIIRLGLHKMLEQIEDVLIIAEARSGIEAVKLASELTPALILMDIGLPEMDGIEATRLIKESLPCKILMITSHESEEDVLAGLSAGADAYCLKDISVLRLSTAIHAVMEGGVWLDQEIAQTVLQATVSKKLQEPETQPKQIRINPFQLSEREQEVLCLLVNGLSNQQMAERLFLSTETVKTHMRHLMEKLRVSDRTQAAVKAVRQGLVPATRDK